MVEAGCILRQLGLLATNLYSVDNRSLVCSGMRFQQGVSKYCPPDRNLVISLWLRPMNSAHRVSACSIYLDELGLKASRASFCCCQISSQETIIKYSHFFQESFYYWLYRMFSLNLTIKSLFWFISFLQVAE